MAIEHLKRFQAGQGRIEHKLGEHTQRLGRHELAIAGARRNLSGHDEVWADKAFGSTNSQNALDGLNSVWEYPDLIMYQTQPGSRSDPPTQDNRP